MGKHLFFVHGRHFKPAEPALRENWVEAVGHGVDRDYGAETFQRLQAVRKTFAYYGDVSNGFLREQGLDYDSAADTRDRVACLERLREYTTQDFIGGRGRGLYEALPGRSSLAEFAADTLGEGLGFLRLSERLIMRFAPDIGCYWDPDTAFGSAVRWRLTEPLAEALSRGDDVLLVSHSLGTMIAYDVLWKFSYYGEYEALRDKRVASWITLGSPLADETVKRQLKGAGARGSRRYPNNVRRWLNVAAEDDYIAHDERVADDYVKMRRANPIQDITDARIYNLAVRHGRSNPHHGAGYLVHPTVSTAIASWLED